LSKLTTPFKKDKKDGELIKDATTVPFYPQSTLWHILLTCRWSAHYSHYWNNFFPQKSYFKHYSQL